MKTWFRRLFSWLASLFTRNTRPSKARLEKLRLQRLNSLRILRDALPEDHGRLFVYPDKAFVQELSDSSDLLISAANRLTTRDHMVSWPSWVCMSKELAGSGWTFEDSRIWHYVLPFDPHPSYLFQLSGRNRSRGATTCIWSMNTATILHLWVFDNRSLSFYRFLDADAHSIQQALTQIKKRDFE